MDTGPSRRRVTAIGGYRADERWPRHRSLDDQRRQFEERRLAAFRRRGFSGAGRRIPDHAGRETYALVSEATPCPTVLVHGGVGNTIEWADLAPKLGTPLVIPDRPGFGLSYQTITAAGLPRRRGPVAARADRRARRRADRPGRQLDGRVLRDRLRRRAPRPGPQARPLRLGRRPVSQARPLPPALGNPRNRGTDLQDPVPRR